MDNIYTRVRELLAQEEKKMSPKDIFGSDLYANFLRQKAANIISGTFYTLRNEGFVASQSIEDRILNGLTVTTEYNEKSPMTAVTMDTGYNFEQHIHINTGCDLVTAQEKREQKHLAALGLLYHEIGHVLFSDYPTMRAWVNQLRNAKWFPAEPDRINTTVSGINLNAKLQDKDFLNVLISCAKEINNCLEDGFIEREVSQLCPGLGRDAILTMNSVLYENAEVLENDDPNKERKPGQDFEAALNQILLYALFGEIKIADGYNGMLTDIIYDSIDIIDDYGYERDPQKRVIGTNELLCVLAPLIEQAMQEYEQEQQNQQNPQNQQGQQGQQSQQSFQGAPGSSGSSFGGNGGQANGGGNGSQQQNGNGSAGSNLRSQAAQQLIQQIQQIAAQVGASDKNENNTSVAVNCPPKSADSNTSRQDAGASQGSKGPGGSESGSMAAAQREMSNIVNGIAQSRACAIAEQERTADLNQDGRRMDLSSYGLGTTSVNVTRAAQVPASNIEAYNRAEPEIRAVSRGLQRDIKRILKDRRQGGKRKNLPFGRRLEVSSIVHDDGKYFSRNKLPTETPRLGVGLLVDESGSTNGKLIQAAMTASLVVEDFCRELDIPHLVYGYTNGYGSSTSIVSYAEPNEIDNGNRYRITGMSARGGTPTASAMAYIWRRLKKLPVDVRLLIVITDGCSGDNMTLAGNEKSITKMIRDMRHENIIVVAAGIGEDRKEVEKEFGHTFMDISDIQMMPEQLVQLIKKHLVV